ncbi:MAG: c-type cytochrome [Planctomycetes bacterium]|nr:c-type cytochrome [Planctomycetota bacterium]
MSTPANLRSWIGVIAAVSVTILLVVIIIRNAPLAPPPTATGPPGGERSQPPAQPGVEATLSAAGITITRRLPAPAFALSEMETLDWRLPPGPFEAQLRVTFHPGSVRRAALGARIQGGELTIHRKGKLLAAGKTGAESTVIMSKPAFLPARLVTVTYNFRATGDGPTLLRALWRPQESVVAYPVVTRGGDLLADDAISGRALFERLNCAACHTSPDAELALVLDVSPAPVLEAIGARARPAWVRQWLGGPQQMKPGAAMPALMAADADGRTRIEDLTHFLASLGGPIDEPSEQPDRDLVETGNALYHTVGCVACHGPLKHTGVGGVGQQATVGADANFTPLGPVASKSTPRALAGFLRDPVGIRPAGYMPAQNLTEIEARAIASYLIHLDSKAPPVPSPEFDLDPDRVQRGRALFGTIGCANCHSLGPSQPPIPSRLAAPGLDRIVARAIEPAGEPGGCLARRPPPGAADFSLTAGQRRLLIAFLGSLAVRRSLNAPLDQLAAALSRLNCLACHEFHGTGGPGPLTARYHVTAREIDLGDEGRLPPDLTDVGGRLNPQWLNEVLVNGGTARRYQATRMPQYGQANVDRLTHLFAAAAGVSGEPDNGPPMIVDETEIGRSLVGSRGLNCISCHSIAGRASTNLPGTDLVQMAERLRWGYFRAWLHDPKTLRPNTRMPSFFFDGQSGLREHFAGDADRQVTAMWHYLSLGESLPLPDGLADPAGL